MLLVASPTNHCHWQAILLQQHWLHSWCTDLSRSTLYCFLLPAMFLLLLRLLSLAGLNFKNFNPRSGFPRIWKQRITIIILILYLFNIRTSKRPVETLILWREFLQGTFKPLYIRPKAPKLIWAQHALESKISHANTALLFLASIRVVGFEVILIVASGCSALVAQISKAMGFEAKVLRSNAAPTSASEALPQRGPIQNMPVDSICLQYILMQHPARPN